MFLDQYRKSYVFSGIDTEVTCAQVRVNPVTGSHHATTAGFTRKQKRRLKYGYLLTYSDSSGGLAGSFLMGGKKGVGRKKSTLRCNTIKRHMEKREAGEEVKDIVLKESRSHTTGGVLLYVAAAMVGVWGLILWTLEEPVEKKRK